MKFELYPIPGAVKKSLNEMGFMRPTDIQFKCITPILAGNNVLAIAQTGTGKTAAFVIPVVSRLEAKKSKSEPGTIKCLVMLPTRELALQIYDVFIQISKYTSLKTLCLIGGVDTDAQIKELQKGTDILVTTPGRLFDLNHQGYIHLESVETLVIDEADRMLDAGFIRDINDIVRLIPRKRQTLFFSATIDKEIKKLAYDIVENPIRIQISPKDPVSKNITHAVAMIEMNDKRFFLERLINQAPEKKWLVFVRTKVRAERVKEAMARVGITAVTLHGDKEQELRQEVLQAFKTGETNLMIATDISARGIDIPEVDTVVNYDLPENPENYVHRIGRTGRGKMKGQAVAFCSKEELPMLKRIEELITHPIDRVYLDSEEYNATIDISQGSNKNYMHLIKQTIADDEKFLATKKKKKR